MSSYRLQDVFGVRTPAPEQTYVDRAGLDGRMQYLLGTGRHLVVYGPSKQGKTALRRRALPDDKCVIVQSRQNSSGATIYDDILGKLGINRTVTDETTRGRDLSITGGGEGGINIPFFGKGQAKAEGTAATSSESKTTSEPIGSSSSNIAFVAQRIKDSARRVVIEDFHYMPESAKKRFCDRPESAA